MLLVKKCGEKGGGQGKGEEEHADGYTKRKREGGIEVSEEKNDREGAGLSVGRESGPTKKNKSELNDIKGWFS